MLCVVKTTSEGVANIQCLLPNSNTPRGVDGVLSTSLYGYVVSKTGFSPVARICQLGTPSFIMCLMVSELVNCTNSHCALFACCPVGSPAGICALPVITIPG